MYGRNNVCGAASGHSQAAAVAAVAALTVEAPIPALTGEAGIQMLGATSSSVTPIAATGEVIIRSVCVAAASVPHRPRPPVSVDHSLRLVGERVLA